MKKLLKPACLGFYVLMLFFFFMLGIYYADLTDAAKNQGLAGGAIVLGYGVLFGGIGFVASFFIAYFLQLKIIKIVNWVLLVIILSTWGYKFYQFQQRDKDKPDVEEEMKPKPVSTEAAPTSALYRMGLRPTRSAIKPENSKLNTGMGFFKPNLFGVKAMYFYGNPNLEKPVLDHSPNDSITFREGPAGVPEIATAPPYLVPVHLKLDYSILYFRIVSVTHEFAEVVVNEQNGQTAYVDKRAGEIQLWPDFLLKVNSVEFAEGIEENIYTRHFEKSAIVSAEYDFLAPKRIRGNWMEVQLMNDSFDILRYGWIRWKKDDQILITYSLLS